MSIITKEQNFLLADLRVLPSRNSLQLGERQLNLQPKVMEVLQYLALHQERVVSSDELMAELWPGRVVTPASVQKSINALRKAIAELLGEQEVIAHYSKRGYQLLIAPVALESEITPWADAPAASPIRSLEKKRRLYVWLLLLIAIAVLGVLLWLARSETQPLQGGDTVAAQHQLSFTSWGPLVSAPAHARDAEPHPDGQHFAYVREQWRAGVLEGQLLVRNAQQEDWQIANSQGTWVALAWSPSGQQLVAVEQWRHEGISATPNFYEAPNYLYTLHVFSLDLANHRLLEKHLLSQWLGRVNSITWWDEQTLEFVAAQGQDASYERYRYRIADQSLLALKPLPGMPLQSAVYREKTLLVSTRDNRIAVDLLNKAQEPQASWQFDFPAVDASWIPDGSGVLLYAESRKALLALYWSGELKELRITHNPQRALHRPRYSRDGKSLYLGETIARSSLRWLDAAGVAQPLPPAAQSASLAAWPEDATQIAYVVEQDGQWQVQLFANNTTTTLLTLAAEPAQLLWSREGQHLVYRLGRQLVFFSLADNSETRLPLEMDGVTVIAYGAQEKRVWVIKQRNGARSLWSIDVNNLQQKQLSFGALASVLARQDKIYFQYQGKPGLWVISSEQGQPQLVQDSLQANVELLAADDTSIYFVRGGDCHETDITRLVFATGEHLVQTSRNRSQVKTLGFHPAVGSLESDCQQPDANILLFR